MSNDNGIQNVYSYRNRSLDGSGSMTSFPRSPRLTKGAIVSFDISSPVPQVIPFQYNPDSLTRTLQASSGGGGEGDSTESFRLKGPPAESISLDVELDATDNLEHPDDNRVSASMGIYPQLAAFGDDPISKKLSRHCEFCARRFRDNRDYRA